MGPPYRLCVCVKKRLLLFDHYSNDWVYNKELLLPDVPASLAWAGHALLCGYRKEYNMLRDDTGESKTLHPVEAEMKPLARGLENSDLCAVEDCMQDVCVLLTDTDVCSGGAYY